MDKGVYSRNYVSDTTNNQFFQIKKKEKKRKKENNYISIRPSCWRGTTSLILSSRLFLLPLAKYSLFYYSYPEGTASLSCTTYKICDFWNTQICKPATAEPRFSKQLLSFIITLPHCTSVSWIFQLRKINPVTVANITILGRNPSLLTPEKGKSLTKKSGRRKDDRYIHPTCLIRPWTKLLSSPVAERSHQGDVCEQSTFSICSKFCWAVLRHSNISHHTNRPQPRCELTALLTPGCTPRSTLQSSVRVIPVELRNAPVHIQHCSPCLAPLQGTNHWHHRDSHNTGGLNLKLPKTSDVRGKVQEKSGKTESKVGHNVNIFTCLLLQNSKWNICAGLCILEASFAHALKQQLPSK